MRSGMLVRGFGRPGRYRRLVAIAAAALVSASATTGCARASSEVAFPAARAGAAEPRTGPAVELAGADAVLVHADGSPRNAPPSGEGTGTAGTAVAPFSVTFHPAPGSLDVALDTPVAVDVRGGALLSLAVTSPQGPVAGELDATGTFRAVDGLRFATEYTLEATVRDAAGARSVQRAAFATMAEAETTEAYVYPNDGDVVGVGMPVIVSFLDTVPEAERQAVTARLSVHSQPEVQGAWRWVSDSEVHWRPLTYWPAHTEVWVAAKLGGTRAGGRWFTQSTMQHFTIGEHHRFTVDADTHQMIAFFNGALVRQMPISTGRDAYPTASGIDLIMEKHDVFEMDSSSVGIYGSEAYNVVVDDAMRLTNSGTFIHAAPWNGSLGEANLSHGCINASNEDAQWMMDNAYIGDPVEISNTPEQVSPGNGWGDWNLSATQWLAEATI